MRIRDRLFDVTSSLTTVDRPRPVIEARVADDAVRASISLESVTAPAPDGGDDLGEIAYLELLGVVRRARSCSRGSDVSGRDRPGHTARLKTRGRQVSGIGERRRSARRLALGLAGFEESHCPFMFHSVTAKDSHESHV